MKPNWLKYSLGILGIAVLTGACSRKYESNFPWGYFTLAEEVSSASSATASATIESYSDVILAESSLLAYWRLNETPGTHADSKGSNTGTLTGTTGTNTSSAGATNNNDNNNALCLTNNTGDDYRVVVPFNAALEFTTGNSITLEAWVQPSNLNPKMTLLSQGRATGTENSNYTLRINGAKIGFFFTDTGLATTAVYRTDDYILKPGNWYHIAVTHTYGSIADTAIYINGIQRTGSWIQGAGTETPHAANESFSIGASDGPGAGINNVVGGCIDEVAVYNSILSIATLRQHYRVANNRFVKLLPARHVVGAGDSLFLDPVGGTTPYTYSIVSGTGTVAATGVFTAPATQGASVVRVTDAAGNTDEVTINAFQEPDDIGNLQVWLKADSLNLADTASVAIWNDSSGNSNDATAVVAPAFTEAVVNGLPGIKFDGAATNMNLSTITYDPSAQAFTIFAVFNSTAGAGQVILSQYNGAGTGHRIFFYRGAGGVLSSSMDAGIHDAVTAYTANSTVLYSMTWNLASLRFFLAGAADGASALTAISANGNWILGMRKSSTQYLNGGIAEFLIYDASLAAADRQVIECYLGEKYNLTIDPGHGCP